MPAAGPSQSTNVITKAPIAASTARCVQRAPAKNRTAASAAPYTSAVPMSGCRKTSAVRIDRRRRHERDAPERDGEALTRDEVALVADDVVPRHAGHDPEAVADESGDSAEQQPVESAHVGGDAAVLERARTGERASGDVVGHQSAAFAWAT